MVAAQKCSRGAIRNRHETSGLQGAWTHGHGRCGWPPSAGAFARRQAHGASHPGTTVLLSAAKPPRAPRMWRDPSRALCASASALPALRRVRARFRALAHNPSPLFPVADSGSSTGGQTGWMGNTAPERASHARESSTRRDDATPGEHALAHDARDGSLPSWRSWRLGGQHSTVVPGCECSAHLAARRRTWRPRGERRCHITPMAAGLHQGQSC